MCGIRKMFDLSIRSLRALIVSVTILALSDACFFEAGTKPCEYFDVFCAPGWTCAAVQSTCIPIGGCGDGLVGPGEACDDGNIQDGDGCSRDCTNRFCGNGIGESGEECDDGNIEGGDGCNANCLFEGCGNRMIDMNEECDSGLGDSPGCNRDCTFVRCGDGYVNQAAGEECDTGGVFTSSCIGSSCRLSFCGDNYLNFTAGEVCDPPGDGGCPGVQACNNSCTACI